MEEVLQLEINDQNDLANLIGIIEKKNKQLVPIVKEINLLFEKDKLEVELNDLIGSFCHMMLNRIFNAR